MKKALTMAAVLLLVLALGIGGTLAYLTSTTDTVTNTFTVGNVSISFTEHKYDTSNTASVLKQDEKEVLVDGNAQSYKLIPGTVYYKDPTVTVDASSEDCYLFVKFEEENTPSSYLTYTSTLTANNNWTQGDGTNIPTNVWYREVKSTDTTKTWHLLDNDTVTVSENLTNTGMPTNQPQLKYTAYAIQKANITDAADAWSKLNPTSGN